jgi:hypothetical protein
MADQLIGLIFGGLIGFLGSLLVLFVTHWLNRRREDREREKWQLTNINTYYYNQYLRDDIKESRKRLDSYTGKDLSLLKTLRKDRRNISHALQRIGVMVYLGGIPLSYALVMNSYQIVHDWLLIASYVEDLRGSSRDTTQSEFHEVPYHRRHGEWLALICWMWLQLQPFSVDPSSFNDMAKFEEYYGDYQELTIREKLLFSYEKRLAAPSTIALVHQIRSRFFRLRIKKSLSSVLSFSHYE